MTIPRRIYFACGQLGMMMLARFFFSWNLRFADQRSATGEILLSASIVGLVFFGARIFDGVTDPIAGALSDGWARRGRERRSLLLFSFALPAVGLVLIFMPSFEMISGIRWALTLLGMFLFFVGYTFYGIPYWSLTDDYSQNDPGERRILSSALGAGLLLATAVVALLSPFAIGSFGYLKTAVLFGVVATGLMVLPYFGQPKTLKTVPAESSERPPALRKQLLLALKHRRFLALLLIFSGSQMAFTVVTAAAPFIAEGLLGGTEKDVATIMAPFLGTAIPFFILTPYLSRKLGWEKTIVIASLALGVVYTAAAGLGGAWIGTPMTTAMLVFGAAGPMAAMLLGVEAEAITACAKEQGGETTSLYFGVFNFVIKALNGLAVFITGLLVSLSGDPGFATSAIRAMPILAGVLLFLGVIGYVGVRRRAELSS